LQAEDLKAATTRDTLPLPEIYPAEKPRKITAEEREFQAFRALRVARANARHEGVRKIRQAKVSAALPSSFMVLLTGLNHVERGGGGKQEEVMFSPNFLCLHYVAFCVLWATMFYAVWYMTCNEYAEPLPDH
jgi:hypothetical protein